MESIACIKYVLFLLWWTLFANAQPGFLSIDCGGERSHTDKNNITWVPDDGYIHNLGEKAESYYKDKYWDEYWGEYSDKVDFYLGSLRVFPKPLNKSCYELPLTPNVPHLLRVSFLDANSTRSRGFNYSVEAADMLYMEAVIFDSYYWGKLIKSEKILFTADKVVHICLIRTSECDDPFISAIELRRLQTGMYEMAKPGTMLHSIYRENLGGDNNITRYPQDPFDRLWYHWWPLGTNLVNVSNSVSVGNTKNFPPANVMQTAVVSNTSDSGSLYLNLGSDNTGKSVVLLYFAKLNSSETTSFSVGINNVIRNSSIDLVKDLSAIEVAFEYNGRRGAIVSLESNIPHQSPIINAVETYSLVPTQPATSGDDVNALREVGKTFSLNNWTSDPCFGLPWEGITCKIISNTVRISQINLSGRHLRGSIPPSFGQLTEFVSLSLDNNYLSGTLPNLTSLSKLKTLHLQQNNLIGTLPDWISKFPSLKELSLNNNYFNGTLPNLTSLSKLETLHLQHNNLTGTLDWISKFPGLKELSLDNNYFNGRFPNLSNLTKLETLHLQNNNLSGKLPDWLSKLRRLKELNISNNDFTGVIPPQLLQQQLLHKINFTFNGNKHLCRTQHECHDHSPSMVVVGVGVAGGLILTAILVGIIIYRIKLKSACAQPNPLEYLMVNLPNSSKSRAFTLEEMTMATENFTRKIGIGSFGTVFLGKLQEGNQIAVKVLSIFSKHGIAQFLNEVDLLSRINHKKLVSFLGYCNESRDLMLVYEYMSGGSLSDNLYDPQAPKYPQLDWKTRLKIALDAAQGLEYLHVGCTPKIIHRDVKTCNILVDSNLNGKLADFGLSRVISNEETSHINTTIKGTPGYLDPMYYKTHILTDKSDVYSFGIVLLELICGRKPIDIKVSSEKIFLTDWVAPYAGVDKEHANIREIVDKRLGNSYKMKSIIHLVNLAWRCIASEPSCRPTISEVVTEIKEAIAFEEEYYQVPDEVSLTFTSSFPTSL